MKQILLILAGIAILIVLGYLIWRFISPAFLGDGDIEDNQNEGQATTEEIDEVFSSTLSSDSEAILGETISLDKNNIVSILSADAFWVSPLGGDKNLLVIEASDEEFAEGDIVSVVGEVKVASEFKDSALGWPFTSEEIEILRKNPIVIEAQSVEKVEQL